MSETAPNSSHAIEQTWDRLAGEYDRSIGPAGARRPLAAIELAAILREIPGGAAWRVFDAGGGTGYHAIKLAELGHSLTLVDISARMVAIAREAAKQAGVEDRMRVVKADIRRMGGAARGPFDVVISCGTVVSDCGSPADALLAFSKALRLGGTACFSVRGLNSVPEESPHMRALFEDKGTRIVRGHQAFDWHLFSRRGVQRLCASVGLSLERAVPVCCEAPPEEETDRTIEEYVRRHLDLTDDENALTEAAEMMAVAAKPADELRA